MSYKTGHKGKSTAGYIAGDVQIQVLSKKFKHRDEEIQFIWDCGGNIKSQRCPLRHYIEPDTSRALGFHDLFTKTEVEANGCIIKVTCNITFNDSNKKNHICSDEQSDLRPQTEYQNRKRRFQTTLHSQSTKKQKRDPTPKQVPQTWENKRFDSSKINEVFDKTRDDLEMETSFEVIATIDCFAAEDNRQEVCTEYITKEMDFFHPRYDSVQFWKDQVAWCYPPHDRQLIERMIWKFQNREMRGYVCIVNHHGCHTQQWCKNIYDSSSAAVLQRADGYDGPYCYGDKRSHDDIVIFYINYQSK